MKLLYVARERGDAEAAAAALHAAAQNVTVLWSAGLSGILEWIDQHDDLAALIVDAHVDRTGWGPLLEHFRRLPTHPAVIAIAAEGIAPDLELLGADDLLTKDRWFGRELALAVRHVASRARERREWADGLNGIEQELAAARAAVADAEERHRAEMAAAVDDARRQRARFEMDLARATAAREMVDEQLHEAVIEVDRVRRSHESASLACVRLERQLARSVMALDRANERAAHELRTATDQLAEERRDLEARIAQEIDTRRELEKTLGRLAGERQAAEDRHALAAAEAAARRRDIERRLAAAEAALQAASARESRERLTAAKIAAQRQAEFDERLREERSRRHSVEQAFSEANAALHKVRQDHDAAVRAIANAEARAAREREEAADRQADLEGRLAEALALRATLEGTLAAARSAALERERSLDDAIHALRADLDAARRGSERRFEEAQPAMLRCRRDGTVTQANRAWSTLVRAAADDPEGADITAAAFESPNDLRWLIDRSLSTKAKESIETTLRRKDGARLFARLSARAWDADLVEITAEDLTPARVLQDRLAQAARMEAVGRLASEVALTCGKLLDDARENAERWVMDGSLLPSRQHGRSLLDDLTRATGYLQELAVYGEKQRRAPAMVDLPTVVRNLAPVLKHVAGGHVDVRLPARSPSLTVDTETEQVERLLVNLAAYGRGRMPSGGRLTIEVGTSIVDRQFTARYPNVRPGPHALITISEARRAVQPDTLEQLRDSSNGRSPRATFGHTTGIELGTIQGLVGECGGHLWMKVEPLGGIVAKIRLPLRTSYGPAQSRPLLAVGGRARAIARLFQH